MSNRCSRSPASAQRDNWTDRGRARVSCQPGRWLPGLGPAGRKQDTRTAPPGLGSGTEPVPVFFTKATHARSLCTTPHHTCVHTAQGTLPITDRPGEDRLCNRHTRRQLPQSASLLCSRSFQLPGPQAGAAASCAHPVTSGADRRLMGGSRAHGSMVIAFLGPGKQSKPTAVGKRVDWVLGQRSQDPGSSSGLCDLERGAGAWALG